MIHFANPLLLFGLLGTAVPILLHLLHKRKPRRIAFAAIELVQRSVVRVERRFRLKRYLVLLSRMTLLAALALAAARPSLGNNPPPLAMALSGAKRLGIVVDASLSMRAKYGDRSAFQRAISEARNLIENMGPDDQALIIAAAIKPELLVPRPTAAREDLLSALENLQPSYASVDLADATNAARAALSEAPSGPMNAQSSASKDARSAHIIVLTDLAGHAFQGPIDLHLPSSPATIEVRDVLADVAPSQRHNHAITSLEAHSMPGQAPRVVAFRARIQTFAPEMNGSTVAENITLRDPQRDLEKGLTELTAGTVTEKILSHAFDTAGFVAASMALDADTLAEDDVRFVTVDVTKPVRTLIVDGAPSGVPKEDEAYYLERALLVGTQDQPSPKLISPDDLSHCDLSAFDVVVLAGVNTFSRSEGTRLVEFVERGGGLFISISRDLDFELYNTELGRILPRHFRGLKHLDPEKGGLGADGLVTFHNPNQSHPILEVFKGSALSGLLSTRTWAYAMLEPNPQRSADILIEYEDGQPALLETSAGSGRVLLLTTSIDRQLTDLPIRPGFLPLARRIILELGRSLKNPDPRQTLVGEPRRIRVPAGTTRMTVTTPEGHEQIWSQTELSSALAVNFENTRLPGQYSVKAAGVGPFVSLEGESFAVNVDTRESDLRPISGEEAEAILLGSGSPNVHVMAHAGMLSGSVHPETMVSALLWLMLAAFVLEGVLLR